MRLSIQKPRLAKNLISCLPFAVFERLLRAEEVEQLLNVTEARHEDQHSALYAAVLR